MCEITAATCGRTIRRTMSGRANQLLHAQTDTAALGVAPGVAPVPPRTGPFLPRALMVGGGSRCPRARRPVSRPLRQASHMAAATCRPHARLPPPPIPPVPPPWADAMT